MRQFALWILGVSLICSSPAGAADASTNTGAPANSGVSIKYGNFHAQEYFGKKHLSIVQIRRAVNHFAMVYAIDPDHAASIFPKMVATEDALHDWSARFPGDPRPLNLLFRMERLYLQIGGADGTQHAADTVAWFDAAAPNSGYTRSAHALFNRLATVSDDGTPVTGDTPQSLGVIPGLVPDPDPAPAGVSSKAAE